MIYEIDPLEDPRWAEFLRRHPDASVFHTRGWLEALRKTYGYTPSVLTTAKPHGDLMNGLVICRVQSWLTGRRIVSLPFSDHCEPLVNDTDDLAGFLAALRDQWKGQRWKYVEIRPLKLNLSVYPSLGESQTFCWHRLDLRPSLEDLFRGFHKDCIRRKIARAEREGLSYEEGHSESLLQRFYLLVLATRRRQHSLPPPISWYRNLIACMGDVLKIRLASKNGQPVAGILTLSYKSTLVYKYGCSDLQFSNLGGTQLLFWKAIQEAKRDGLQELDMGRSDEDAHGLIEFKGRWGATRSTLTYWRFGPRMSETASAGKGGLLARRLLGQLPDRLFAEAGAILYRHAG